jgi:RNA polymerase sigma-70 factor (ECF subfamily)
MQRSDQALITQIQAHDATAFEAFYDRYHALLHRHVLAMVRETVATEDLVQEVFLRVWTRAEQWDGTGSVKAWLYRIATNLALNHLRTVRRHPQQPLEAVTVDDMGVQEEINVPNWLIDAVIFQPPAMLEVAERMRQLQRLVDELPDDKREVFWLVYEAELDLRTVAAQLGIPEGTVKSRLYYSKQQLKNRWETEHE